MQRLPHTKQVVDKMIHKDDYPQYVWSNKNTVHYVCHHVPTNHEVVRAFSTEQIERGEKHCLELIENWNRLGGGIYKYWIQGEYDVQK